MIRAKWVGLSALVLAVCIPLMPAWGDDTYWRHDPATPGDWYNAANWTNGRPVYKWGNNAYIDNGGTAEISGVARTDYLKVGGTDASTVVQYTGSDVETGTIYVGYYAGTTGVYELNDGELRYRSGAFYKGFSIGYNGSGTFRQTGGNLIRYGMSVGTGATGDGLFELTGGSATAGSATVIIGPNGVFRQTGGSFTNSAYGRRDGFRVDDGGIWQLSGNSSFDVKEARYNNPVMGGIVQSGGISEVGRLIVGDLEDSGFYLLTGGRLTSSLAYIGPDEGTSFFRQTGATHVAGTMYVGKDGDGDSGSGTYQLMGGDMVVDELHVGYGHKTTGTFEQTGGANTVGYLRVYEDERYEYSAGTLELTGRMDLQGTLDLMGADVTLYARDGAWLDLTDTTGAIANAGAGTLDCSENSVTIINPGADLGAVFAAVDMRGVLHTLGDTFVVPAGKTITTSGEIADHVICAGTLLRQPEQGLTLLNGLEMIGEAVVDLLGGELTVNDKVSGMTGGQLSTNKVIVRAGAKFTQSGGSVYLGRISAYGAEDDEAVYEFSGGDLTVTQDLFIGGASYDGVGAGRFVQTGGVVVAEKNLSVSGTFSSKQGIYQLVEGQLSADVEALGAYQHTTGFSSYDGRALLRQTGGSNSTRLLVIGGASAYELAGGRLEVAEDLAILGRMSQSGGTAVVGGPFVVYGNNGLNNGLYELSGGDLTAPTESIGDIWTARFVQTGGANTTDSLTIAATSRYELSGGVLQINDQLLLNGQLDFAGGNAQLLIADGGMANFVLGELLNAAGTSMIAGANTDVFFPVGFNPYTDFDSYVSGGQTHLAGDMFDVPAGQTVYLAGDIYNSVRCAGTVLPVPETDGANLLAGVEVLPGGNVDIGGGTLTVDDDKSSISGGSLTGLSLRIGSPDGAGAFAHSDGVVAVENFEIGFNAGESGSYEFGGGTINAKMTRIGYYGTGSFRQTAGTFNSNSSVYVGRRSGGVGTYEMSGGTLNSSVVAGGDGEGHFLQSGGRVQGSVVVYNYLDQADEEAKYEMSGDAVVDAANIRVGSTGYAAYAAGRFSQTSPDNIVNVSQELSVARGGTYELIDGLLTAEIETILETGVFRQSGGRNQAKRITVKADGRYEYAGGELAFDNMTVEGVFDLNDKLVTLSLAAGLMDISLGGFEGAGNATLDLGAQVLLIAGSEFDPGVAFGTFSNQGVLYTLGSTLVVPQGRGFSASIEIEDLVECRGSIQPGPGGYLNLSGGLALHGGVVQLGGGEAYMGPDGGITGGQLLGGTLEVSSAEQSGGLVKSRIVVRGTFVVSGGEIDTPKIELQRYLVQNAGTVDASEIVIGTRSAVRPTRAYTMAGGQLTIGRLIIGDTDGNPGGLHLTGGRTDVAGRLVVGGPIVCGLAGKGQVELEGSAVLTAGKVYVGSHEPGDFIQTGGVHNADELHVGQTDAGHYELQAGELNVAEMYVGCVNGERSDIMHTGGTAEVSGDLSFSGNGVYELQNGELTVRGTSRIGGIGGVSHATRTSMFLLSGGRAVLGSVIVGQYEDAEKGRFGILGAEAHVEVADTLAIGPRGEFRAVPGAVIHMTGSAFSNESTDPAALAGLADLTLVFEGGAAEVDPFEVAGQDMGPVLTGFADNFALGTLSLGGADIGKVRLYDTFDNQDDGALGNEALYVTGLNIGAGSYLDLNGLNLYYLNFTDSGGTIDFRGGSMTQVPEPGTLMLIVVGFPMLLKRYRR